MSGLVLDELLNDIAPGLPCGESLEYDAAYIDLGKKILGTPEDPFTKEPAQPPNWKEVRKDALAILKRTRDLRIILYLTRALLHTEGFPGFRDGLALLEGALQAFWPTLHPQLDPEDDNDPTQRVNLIMELADFETVLRPLAFVPVVESRSIGRFNLRDAQLASDKSPPPAGVAKPDPVKIQAAFREALDTDAEALMAAYRAVGESLASLSAIEAFVTDQVDVGNAPNLETVRALLKEIRAVFEQHGVKEEVPEVLESVADGDAGAAGKPGAAGAAGSPLSAITGRQDVVRALDLLCDYYARCEPSSPVPLLLLRARRLVTMNFMELLKELAPNGLPQVEVLKGPDSEGPGS